MNLEKFAQLNGLQEARPWLLTQIVKKLKLIGKLNMETDSDILALDRLYQDDY